MPIPGNSNVTITGTPTATQIPSVVEQVEGWEFNENYEGATGSRIFIDAFAVPGQPAQDLPQIGAPFSADWPLVTLKSISVKYKSPRSQCPKIYICRYDSKPLWSMYGANQSTIPKPITNTSIGGEYLTYTNPMYMSTTGETQWRWFVGGTYTNAPDLIIGNLEYSETVTKTRYIYPGASLKAWRDAVKTLVGTCNFDPVFDEQYEQGILLFMGADLSEMTNESDVKMWKADMKFKARYVVNRDSPSILLGWNYIFNAADAKYELLVDRNGDFTYAYTDFTTLLTTSLPPITMGNNLPAT